jgi:hypothetical protein
MVDGSELCADIERLFDERGVTFRREGLLGRYGGVSRPSVWFRSAGRHVLIEGWRAIKRDFLPRYFPT